MKPIIAATLLACAAVSAHAADDTRTVNALQIVRTDGQTDWMKLADGMTIGRSDDHAALELSHPQVKALYPLAEIKQLQFGYKNMADGTYYTGNNQAEIHSPGIRFDITPTEISVDSGLTITLYNIDGTSVATGRGHLNISSLPHGIYLVNAANRTIKLKI